jgi:hypothetical protein
MWLIKNIENSDNNILCSGTKTCCVFMGTQTGLMESTAFNTNKTAIPIFAILP